MSCEFNLLDEPWIRVLNKDCVVSQVSWKDALLHAEDYVDLAGELPTQDIAILRQLLAMLYSIFLHQNVAGNVEELQSVNDSYERWNQLWQTGHFPAEPIQEYCSKWHDRFWLFHEARPFGQTISAQKGTEYTAAKLNGAISESSNKSRLFPGRIGGGKETLSYAEAARWLIYTNAYDDTSAKPKGKNLPSVGAGWLGKIGLIQAVGNNLFETLMLTLVLAKDGDEGWKEGSANWELDQVREDERMKIHLPENPSDLLTLQSRRLYLKRKNNLITGFYLLGGDFFDREGAYAEQMTVWRRTPGKKNEPDIIQPRRHDASRQMWRDLASIIEQSDDSKSGHLPGVVSWVSRLKTRKLLSNNEKVRFRIASVQYGDKDFFVTDVFGDSLLFHSDLLTQAGYTCRKLALDEIKRCDTLAYYVGQLANELCLASGSDTKKSFEESPKTEIYYRLDEPFRIWLEQLNPDDPDELDDLRKQWREQSEKIVMTYGKELADSAGPQAFIGRYVDQKENGKEIKKHYSTSEAYNKFQYLVRKTANKMEG